MTVETLFTQTRRSATNRDIHVRSGSATLALIQEVSTRRYLAVGGDWTPDSEKAATFRSVAAAMDHVRQLKLVMVQLVSNRNVNVCEVLSATHIGVDGWSRWLTRAS